MTGKIRKQIYIEPTQESMLKRMAETTGRSEAEIIRQAIDQYTLNRTPIRANPTAWKQEKEFLQQLIGAGPVQGGWTWRREDLYDR